MGVKIRPQFQNKDLFLGVEPDHQLLERLQKMMIYLKMPEMITKLSPTFLCLQLTDELLQKKVKPLNLSPPFKTKMSRIKVMMKIIGIKKRPLRSYSKNQLQKAAQLWILQSNSKTVIAEIIILDQIHLRI